MALRWGCAALLVCIGLVGAVEPATAAPKQQDCRLKQVASLDLVVRDGILVPVTLDGHAGYMELRLESVLSDFYQGSVDPIGLQHRTIDHMGVYSRGEQLKETAKFGSLLLGRANFGNGEFVLLPVPSKGDVFGMLGMSFFSKVDFELDLARKKMNLFTQDHCPGQVVYWSDSFASAPLKPAPLGGLFFELELEDKTVAASWSPFSSTTRLTTDASRRLFGFDETSQGIETDASGTGHYYRAMRITAPGLSAMNIKVLLVPNQQGGCGQSTFTDSHVTRSNTCLETPPLSLGRNVLEAMRLYFATKERVLYFTAAGDSD